MVGSSLSFPIRKHYLATHFLELKSSAFSLKSVTKQLSRNNGRLRGIFCYSKNLLTMAGKLSNFF